MHIVIQTGLEVYLVFSVKTANKKQRSKDRRNKKKKMGGGAPP